MKSFKGWCLVDRRGNVQAGVLATQKRFVQDSITDLAKRGTREASWDYWKEHGFEVVRCEVFPGDRVQQKRVRR